MSRALDRELLRLQITVPILAVSGTLLALWPLVGWPRTIEDGSCGGVITPVVAGPVVAVSAALVALASVRKRRYHREGQTALPRTVRQRFARGIGIGLLTFVIGSGVAGPLFVDSLCYT